jgi:N-acetylmuramic acid 6-phosphate etherase
LTCTSESELSQIADIIIASVVGPEAITGSTRMKSATAHKMVLNMISTGVMIKLGKVYENLMIDIKPSNVKLHNRRTRVVAQALDVENTKAEELLNMSNGNTRLAILMGLGGLTVNQAQKLLETYDNDIKACLRDELCQQEHQEGNHHPLFE